MSFPTMLAAEATEKDLSYFRIAIVYKPTDKSGGSVAFAFDRTFQFPCTSCTPNNRRLSAARMAALATGFRLIVDSALRDETVEEVRAWEAGRARSDCVCERLRRSNERARKPTADEKVVIDAQLSHLTRMDGVALATPPPSNTNKA